MDSERNLFNNGRFLTNLSSWTATGAVYTPSDGDEQYGIASLAVGGTISQPFFVPAARNYSLHIAVKPESTLSGGAATLSITQSGVSVTTFNLVGSADVWTEQTFTLGLVPGAAYIVTISAVTVAIKADDAWLWFVPMARSALAVRVHTRLGALATDAGLSVTPSGALTEGSYTYAIDAGLRQIGAIDPYTAAPDIRYLGITDTDPAIEAIEREMLQQLYRTYSLQVDITVGPRRESLSQIAKSIEALLSTKASGSRQVKRVRVKRDDTWPLDTYDNGYTRFDNVLRVKDDDGL